MPYMSSLYTVIYPSPLGRITLASEGVYLVGLWFDGQKHYGAGLPIESATECLTEPLQAACDWLDAYFAGEQPSIANLSLRPSGTAFRQAVWERLLHIPYGCTTGYGAIAEEMRASGLSASPRAVGGAVAHNPISLIIPCHRVIAADPSAALHYAAGPHIKQALLRHEQNLTAFDH